MPISCHFRDYKALLVTSLTHVSGAIASVHTFTFTFTFTFYSSRDATCLRLQRLQRCGALVLIRFCGLSRTNIETPAQPFFFQLSYTKRRVSPTTFSFFTARRVCIARTMPWQDVCLSVGPSVCHTPVFCRNGYAYHQTFFTFVQPNHPSFSIPNVMTIL